MVLRRRGVLGVMSLLLSNMMGSSVMARCGGVTISYSLSEQRIGPRALIREVSLFKR